MNDQRRLLGQGEIAVALSYDTHGYRTPKTAEALYLIIPTSFYSEFEPLFSGRHLRTPYLNDPTTSQTVLDAMEKLLICNNEILRKGLVYVILGVIFDKMATNDDALAPQAYHFPTELLIYISKHFQEELTLTQLAKEYGYNPSYLSRSFRQTLGISFVQYLTMLRLRATILRLQTRKQTITECALSSGFGSMRSFYRAFREEFGCSPKEYLNYEIG